MAAGVVGAGLGAVLLAGTVLLGVVTAVGVVLPYVVPVETGDLTGPTRSRVLAGVPWLVGAVTVVAGVGALVLLAAGIGGGVAGMVLGN